VLDRLCHLGGDRQEQVDFRGRELPGLARAHVQRALKLLTRQDRDGEDRLVLLLGQVHEPLEPRVEMRLRGDHHRSALLRRDAGDPLTRPHPRASRHLLDRRPVRRPQHELPRPLLVQVDEARVGAECLCHVRRDQLEHLLEVKGGVDRGDRVRQEAQMARWDVHAPDCRSVAQDSPQRCRTRLTTWSGA
jgi:hypothetical protein